MLAVKTVKATKKLVAKPKVSNKARDIDAATKVTKPAPLVADLTKYSDKYQDNLIKKVVMDVTDTKSIVFALTRAGEDGLPHLDIREYINSERYQGATKKGIRFPLELVEEFLDALTIANDRCSEKGF